MVTSGVLTSALLVTIAIGSTATLLAWRERPEPGALPLVALLVGQSLWSIFLVFKLQSDTLAAKILWEQLTWVGVVIIPVAWLLFALEYTGRDEYLRARYVAFLSVVPAITVVLALTSQSQDLLYGESWLVQYNGHAFLHREAGPWLWIITGYTYLLGVLGSLPLLSLIQSKAATFRGQSGALLLGTVAPWASNALFLAGFVPIPALDPTPIAFSISGISYLGAVTQFRLFGTSPSANQHARRLLIDQLKEGAVVVDSHDYVVDINDSATRILDVDPREALGKPAADVIPDYERLTAEELAPEQRTIHSDRTDRLYDVTHTEIVDNHDRTVGTIFTFHDISDHVHHQQRHEVLNRVFRHNIRTETDLIIGHTELLSSEESAGEAASVKRSALRIKELAEKARAIISIFEERREPTKPTPLSSLVEYSVSRTRSEYPDVDVDVANVPEDVYVAGVLETVFVNIVENAAMHNDDANPRIEITVTEADATVEVHIADNGPGIAKYERAVLERGTENSLEHGSGLGLWLIKWGAEIADGGVRFEENDPSGAVVVLTLPKLHPPASEQSADGAGGTDPDRNHDQGVEN